MMRVSEISKNTLFELRDWRRWMDILWAMHAVWFTYWCLHQIKSLLKAGFLSSVCLCFNINMSRKLKLNVREVFIRVETFGIKMWYIKIKKAYVVSKRCKMSQFWIFFLHPYPHAVWTFWCMDLNRPKYSYSVLISFFFVQNLTLICSQTTIFSKYFTPIWKFIHGWYLIFFGLCWINVLHLAAASVYWRSLTTNKAKPIWSGKRGKKFGFIVTV